MSRQWPIVPLGEVLQQRREFIAIDDMVIYRRPRVQLHARGIVLRDQIPGALVKTKSQQVCRAGDFLVAEIDAKAGGYGVVPEALHGSIVSSHYFLFSADDRRLDRRFLDYFSRTASFSEQVRAQGSTNYAAIRPTDVLSYRIPLPPLKVQQIIAARIAAVSMAIEAAEELRNQIGSESQALLNSEFERISAGATRAPMRDVAPLVRRPVAVAPDAHYLELGIRSFGRGTFHKAPMTGLELGNKRVFGIEPNDLLFSNVFAWEGAIAVARPDDAGRIGSHRFITCVPRKGVVTAQFLRFYFLTNEGLDLIRAASPGGAGRNRTLGLAALAALEVPVPDYAAQLHFGRILATVDELNQHREEAQELSSAVVPAILSRTFDIHFGEDR